MTLFNSPMVGTCDLSSCMIFASVFSGRMFSFLQTDKGMTFVEAPESTRQLWTLKLKISKDRRKGGVDPLELVLMAFTIDCTYGSACADVLLTIFVAEVFAKAFRMSSLWLVMRASS